MFTYSTTQQNLGITSLKAIFQCTTLISKFDIFRIAISYAFLVCYNYFLGICTYNHIRIVRHQDNLSIELFSSQIFDQFFKDCPIIKIIFWLIN